MSTPEEKEKRRRRIKRRSAVAHDLHSKKYRQRIIKGKRRLENIEVWDGSFDDLLDDDDLYLDDLDPRREQWLSRKKDTR